MNRERGVALLIVVSVLTVVGIMSVAFAFSMYLETQAARQFVSATQARYVAEAGVGFARALLNEDRIASQIDDETEPWVQEVAGSDVDVDGDGTPEARWRFIEDSAGETVGRYAVQITDEASKGHLSTARADPSPFELGAVNLTALLEEAQVEQAGAVAAAIEAYRYGPDGRPGVALVDDDGDGAVDDVDEYQPLALAGDDRIIEGLEELMSIAGVEAEDLRRIEQVATVYSWDMNVSADGQPRVNVNTASADELLAVMLEAGVEDPWQAAANLADYVDPDLDMSRVTKSSQRFSLANQGPLGGWAWSDLPSGHYESDQPEGTPLTWTVSVPTGTFRVLIKGVSGMKVGDVTLQEAVFPSVDSGESVGFYELDGSLEVTVTHREPVGTRCAFVGVELVPEDAAGGVLVRGIEAVRINELMIEPVMDFTVSAATFNNPQGSGWSCGGDLCTNSGVGSAEWSWGSTLLLPGSYHVWVQGGEVGRTVGEVCVSGNCELLVHDQYHPSTMTVSSQGTFSLTIGKTAEDGTYYLEGVSLSLQPDAEYVELINLTDEAIDVSGWTFQGEATLGQVAQLPEESVIEPHGLLVAAVDLADTQAGLAGNGIDAVTAWEFPDGVNAVQLEFPGGTLSPELDWLKVVLPGGSRAQLTLRSGTALVDAVEYPLPLPTSSPFQSLEKGDPTIVDDADGNGVDDAWYSSLQLYTPGATNDNEGLTETDDEGELIVHDPASEVRVRNRSLEGIGELVGVSSGAAWQPFSTNELAKVVDRLTVQGIRLEAEGHLIEGATAWFETIEGYEHSDPGSAEVAGTWQWTSVPEGSYRLSVYGRSGEQLALRWQLADQSYTEWTPELSTDAQGRLVIGQLTIGMGETAPETLTLQVRCASPSGICHVDDVRLDPRLMRVGNININTAPEEILRALPGVTEAVASRIISGRPFGNQNGKARGIGDLLVGDTLGATEEDRLEVFRQMGHLVTTHSNVFQILSLGEALDGQERTAAQRIRTVIQR